MIPNTQIKHALSTTREGDFAQWYQEVIAEAEMAEESGVRGCMVIKPWGYGIWERIQTLMDARDQRPPASRTAISRFSSRYPTSPRRPSTSRASPRKWRSSPTTGW
jgi:prolyl-tRNA synthetase